MTDARLPAHLDAASLIRRAEVAGGFGVMVATGDRDRGVLILLIANRGIHVACLERGPSATGATLWQRVGPTAGADSRELSSWTAKRRSFDADSWLIELDIPLPERFIAETTAIG